MSKLIALACGLLAWTLVMPAQAFYTPGQFGVSPTGAANYTIPIAVPPGTAGMVPSLSINYDSHGGNGLLGIGWSLSGLSAITRCPKTKLQDGIADLREPIKYDATDKYCLDGQRLALYGGVYGENGAEYRTERESFSRIVSYGSSGSPASGVGYFKVWTKAGLIMEYGNTADSLIEQQGKNSVQVWALSRVTDTVGNYYKVTYQDNGNANGEFYPTRIDYTGNDRPSVGLQPYNSVRFVYEVRPDSPVLYDNSGSKFQITHRLSKIQTYADVDSADTLVKEYRLQYGASPATQRSRITSITECDGANNCLPSTAITWDAASDAVGNAVDTLISSASWAEWPYRYSGDFNGDGKVDLLLQSATDAASGKLCTGLSSTATACSDMTLPGTFGMGVAADFNADGYTDFFNNGTLCLGPTLNGTACSSTGFTPVAADMLPNARFAGFAGDVNGDGRMDLIYYSNNQRGYCLGGALTSCDSLVGVATLIWGSSNTDVFAEQGIGNVTLGDFGGGKTGLIYTADAATAWTFTITGSVGSGVTFTFTTPEGGSGSGELELAPGMLFEPPIAGGTHLCAGSQIGGGGCTLLNTANWGGAYKIHSGDFNGDGISDLYLVGATDSKFCPGPRIGQADNGRTPPGNCVKTVTGDWKTPYTILPGDYNGDGITDLYLVGAAKSMFCAGPGITTADNCVDKHTGDWKTGYDIRPGDYDGDGTTDLLLIKDTERRFVESGAGNADRVAMITNGLGAVTKITYKPMTDNTVYAKGTGANVKGAGYLELQAPMFVVSSVTNSNGVGGMVGSNYYYWRARAHQDGGGFMGFELVRSCDTSITPNICTQTQYVQDYPYQGLPKQVIKFAKNGTAANYLNVVTNTWNYLTADAAHSSLGPIYNVPQLTKSQEVSRELAGGGYQFGSVVTNVTTTNTYDDYGNPKVITVSSVDASVSPSVVYKKVTTNIYDNDTTGVNTDGSIRWLLGRLRSATVSSTTP